MSHERVSHWLSRFLTFRRLTMAAVLLLALPAVAAAPADSGSEVLSYLDQTIEWYHRVSALDQATVNSEELLFRDTVRQNAAQALHLAFAAARGEAARLSIEKSATTAPSVGGSMNAKNLSQAAARANQRVTQAQANLDQVSQQIKTATQPAPETLAAKRDMLVAELNLAKARQEILQDLVTFNATTGAASDLSQRIDDLERSVPEVQANASTNGSAKAGTTVSSSQEPYRPESAGILSLVSEMFTLTGRMRDIGHLSDDTDALRRRVQALRGPIRTELIDAIHRADALSRGAAADDAGMMAGEMQKFNALSAQFRLIAAAEVPLDKQLVFLDSTQGNLREWRGAVARTYGRVIRALLIRVGAIALAIFVLLGISAVWKRATFRYISDPRRRRQFLSIRRLIVWAIIIVIIAGGVVTEFSTLMTFAGLITAGIAVALQTVILSGVAHFFFMGRYGVRVGDRVTISGITGDVIDIGIFRLYLMELGGQGRDLNPTGRIVVFSNSVLFQPSAFFKQLPGVDYGWHEVALTLAPDTDHHLAETKLLGAVDSVFNEYREAIDQQYALVRDNVHFNVPPPEPSGRFRFVDQGLEFVVRYPVDIRRGAEIDDRVTRRLLETIENEKSLRLVASGTPKIQPAEAPRTA